MSWRTVVIGSRCKLDYRMGYMVVRGAEVHRVLLDEVAVLLLENSAISLTGCLVAALIDRKIKVIFCDERRNPAAELVPYYGSHDCVRKLRMQQSWSEGCKAAVWEMIIANKIKKQSLLLEELDKHKEAALLLRYIDELEYYDSSNREGHAAKVYFNALFGMEFSRDLPCAINNALNYGYSILLSAFNRAICAHGYLTQIGIFHDNVFNQFNLSCDLMEPFRISVDRLVVKESFSKFESLEKHRMLQLLHQEIEFEGERQILLNAIRLYTRRILDALRDGDLSMISFPKE